MNKQPFYHCVDFREPYPDESECDRIVGIVRTLVPKRLRDEMEYYCGQLLFTAYRDVSSEAEKRLTRKKFDVIEGSEAEAGDPADLM